MYMEKLNVHFLLSEYRDVDWIFDLRICYNIVLDRNVVENIVLQYITLYHYIGVLSRADHVSSMLCKYYYLCLLYNK